MPQIDRVFLDANVIFSAAHRPDSDFRRLWHLPRSRMYTSTYVVVEVQRNLTQSAHLNELEHLLIETEIIQSVDQPSIQFPEGFELAAKDLPVLTDAILAKTTHLLTGDIRHFGPHYGRTIHGVLIQRPREYLRSALEDL